MRPFDIRHPSRDAKNRDSAALYKLYTRATPKLSTSKINFFSICPVRRTFSYFRIQSPPDERIFNLPDHFINS